MLYDIDAEADSMLSVNSIKRTEFSVKILG